MMRRLLLGIALLALGAPFFTSAPAAQAAPALQIACSNTLSQPTGQSFWVGAPATANANGPVVVFVHGYTSDHTTWSGANYAVRDGCNQGFRVAAVDLGGTSSIWTNGADLRNKLQSIGTYFGVSKVNVIAHSKGGLDTQTAIVHYGAYPFVQTYMAFGSPFGGTDLADHACSWYGSVLWQCNDATRSMRTGYMSYVRSITDGRPENDAVRAYAGRGSKCDWYNPACAMISGSDDGVVPTWSVWANGEDVHISDRTDLRHGEVHQTQRYNVSWLFSFLGRSTAATNGQQDVPDAAPILASSNYTLRGGELTGRAVEQVTVEGGLEAITFSVLSNPGTRVTVVSPSGVRYETKTRRTEAGALLQGTESNVRVARPEAGAWRVELDGSLTATRRPGYLLRTIFEGGLTVTLDSDLRIVHQPGSILELPLRTSTEVADLAVASTLRGVDNMVVTTGFGERAAAQAMALPLQSGVYNLDLHMTGTAADGTPFERTLVTSIAVVDVANLEDPASIR